jgi:hypothetical protein
MSITATNPRALLNSLKSLGAMQGEWNIGTRHLYHQESIVGERKSKGVRYEFYNVLWIEWEDGIAYRKGIGHVEKYM